MDSQFYQKSSDKGVISKNTLSYASRHASGTGAFIPYIKNNFDESHVYFKRFPKYWDTGSKGNIDDLELVTISEPTARMLALFSKEVDIVTDVPLSFFNKIKTDPQFHLTTIDGKRPIFFEMNQKRNEALQNKNVRKAIVYAVNNALLSSRVMDNFAIPAAQISPLDYSGHDSGLQVRYNLEEARDLLESTPYKDGFTLDMAIPNGQFLNDVLIGKHLVSMLSKIGIKVRLHVAVGSKYWNIVSNCDSDMMMLSWYSDTEDSNTLFQHLIASKNSSKLTGDYNCGFYNYPEIDSLYEKSLQEVNTKLRDKYLRRIENIVYNEALVLPLFWSQLSWGSRSDIQLEHIVGSTRIMYLSDLVIR